MANERQLEYFGESGRDYLKDYHYICIEKEKIEWEEWEEYQKRKPAIIKVQKDDVTREVQTVN